MITVLLESLDHKLSIHELPQLLPSLRVPIPMSWSMITNSGAIVEPSFIVRQFDAVFGTEHSIPLYVERP